MTSARFSLALLIASLALTLPQGAMAANYQCRNTASLAPFTPTNTIDAAHAPSTTMPGSVWSYHTGGQSWAVGAYYPSLSTWTSTVSSANPVYHVNPYPGVSSLCRTENKGSSTWDSATWYNK